LPQSDSLKINVPGFIAHSSIVSGIVIVLLQLTTLVARMCRRSYVFSCQKQPRLDLPWVLFFHNDPYLIRLCVIVTWARRRWYVAMSCRAAYIAVETCDRPSRDQVRTGNSSGLRVYSCYPGE